MLYGITKFLPSSDLRAPPRRKGGNPGPEPTGPLVQARQGAGEGGRGDAGDRLAEHLHRLWSCLSRSFIWEKSFQGVVWFSVRPFSYLRCQGLDFGRREGACETRSAIFRLRVEASGADPSIHVSCIHPSIQTCIHASMHPCLHESMPPCLHASMHPCIHAFMHASIQACTPVAVSRPHHS